MITAAIVCLCVIALWMTVNLICLLATLYRRCRGRPPKPINWNWF
jgi:hypothetical protein